MVQPWVVSSIDSQEAGMSGAFPSMHIVVYLPTCQPEDPGTRDASVQVGVTYEDKATQWEEREEADPSLDKPSGANTTANSCPPGPTLSRQAVNNLLRDASVQVGVTCEDKATQWEESVEADPSLDKPSGANSRVAVTSQDKASQWEEGVEAEPGGEEAERKPRLDQGPLLPSREKSSGINSGGVATPMNMAAA
ncbi:UNVERIFIED_CONTAM: hypothetical protein K2H54_010064 [Gekko kuhli]